MKYVFKTFFTDLNLGSICRSNILFVSVISNQLAMFLACLTNFDCILDIVNDKF